MAPAHVVTISVATSGTDFTARDADFAALIRAADGKSLKPRIVPILGTTKLHHLGENVTAATEDISEIDGAVSRITVQGTRYPEKLEQMTGR
jgi:aryl-alcohol dehydrogenase-like predicted oxidoreductase